MSRGLGFLIVLLVLCAPTWLWAQSSFRLQDQYERVVTSKQVFRGRTVIVVAGDQRESVDAMASWLKKLDPQVSKRAALVGLANLDGVPFFVPKSSLRSTLRDRIKSFSVMMDWEGDVYTKLGFRKDNLVSIKIFGPKGKLRGTVRGAFSAAKLNKVKALLP